MLAKVVEFLAALSDSARYVEPSPLIRLAFPTRPISPSMPPPWQVNAPWSPATTGTFPPMGPWRSWVREKPQSGCLGHSHLFLAVRPKQPGNSPRHIGTVNGDGQTHGLHDIIRFGVFLAVV